MSLLVNGGHSYLGSALLRGLPEAIPSSGDYGGLTAVELGQHEWVVFLANRKQEDRASDSARFRGKEPA
jgi:hypothetical protein